MKSPFLEVIAPVHWAISNASIHVMVNCMLAQSSNDWSLTIISDGFEARVEEILNRYGCDRIRYFSTEFPNNDHGHTPREIGLNASRGEWTVLSGIDNYYVPLFVETLKKAEKKDIGLMYWDFLLDMKGELEAGIEYDRALREYEQKTQKQFVLRPIIDGQVIEIAFDPKNENLRQRAALEVARLGLTKGGGCDDDLCIVNLLTNAMRQAAQTSSLLEIGGGRPRALPPYSGHIDANLQISGQIDIGAFAVRTDIAKRVGFRWRHHAADFNYLQACLLQLNYLTLHHHKISQTLYVHN
mmetsp:Transcript_8364/g.11651  ORF Transcript_8364/g.11651 Transcript_8364/m.11651 type:complete len:298 (+) Transcript_8364:19-912(+)